MKTFHTSTGGQYDMSEAIVEKLGGEAAVQALLERQAQATKAIIDRLKPPKPSTDQ